MCQWAKVVRIQHFSGFWNNKANKPQQRRICREQRCDFTAASIDVTTLRQRLAASYRSRIHALCKAMSPGRLQLPSSVTAVQAVQCCVCNVNINLVRGNIRIKVTPHVGGWFLCILWHIILLDWHKIVPMFIIMKEHVSRCNSAAHWCVSDSFWTTTELRGTEEEDIQDSSYFIKVRK